jgi:spermidine/putrescine transport system permease protein
MDGVQVAAPSEAAGGRRDRLAGWARNPGVWWSVPLLAFLAISFVGPLVVVAVYAFTQPGSFELGEGLTVENFREIERLGFLESYWNAVRFAILTVVLTLLAGYPLARALVKTFGRRFAVGVTLLVILPLLVSENIRLSGWTMILGKRGFLDGSLDSVLGVSSGSLLYNEPVIVFGLVYIYLPFMLFPLVVGLAGVPDDLINAARDLGGNRLHVLREVELPLAKPGLVIGTLLVFVLSLGSISEALILGGQDVVVIAADIQRVFGVQQNWPFGSALSLALIVIAGIGSWLAMRRVDLDVFLGRER